MLSRPWQLSQGFLSYHRLLHTILYDLKFRLKYVLIALFLFILVFCAIAARHDLASLFGYILLYTFAVSSILLQFESYKKSAFILNLFKSTKSGPVRNLVPFSIQLFLFHLPLDSVRAFPSTFYITFHSSIVCSCIQCCFLKF